MKALLNSESYLDPFTDNICEIIQPWKLFSFQHLKHEEPFFLSHSFTKLLLGFAYLLIEWYITPLLPLSTANVTLVFKAACHAHLGVEKSSSGSNL